MIVCGGSIERPTCELHHTLSAVSRLPPHTNHCKSHCRLYCNSLITFLFVVIGRAVATIGARGGQLPPPHQSVLPPHQTFRKSKFPMENDNFLKCFIRNSLKFKQYIVKFRGLRPKPRYEHYTLL